MRLAGRGERDVPHRMHLERRSHDENEVRLVAVLGDAGVETVGQILSKEDDVRLDESAAAATHGNATLVDRLLRDRGRIRLVAADAGAGRTGAMALDEDGESESGAPIESVDVLRVDASEKALPLEESEEEVGGRGMILVVGVEHLLREDPKGDWEVGEVVETEYRGRVRQEGNRVLVQVPIETGCGAEVGNARGYVRIRTKTLPQEIPAPATTMML